jgi:abelson tyrosine-protein kinase 1
VHPPLSPTVLQSSPADPEGVRQTLHALRAAQNSQDRARDSADLHQLMRATIDANDDLATYEVFQIPRSEIPEAIKTLERALKHVSKCGQLDAEESTTMLPSPQQEEAGKGSPSVELGDKSPSQCSPDALHRKFIETGIDALRRLSKCTDLSLPNWTVTWYEIELEAKVGFGSFSYVYRGLWCKHTVAIKVLAETTPRNIFLREVKIWKSLDHPNVLELFGASSASGDPPWFLVRGISFLVTQ